VLSEFIRGRKAGSDKHKLAVYEGDGWPWLTVRLAALDALIAGERAGDHPSRW